METRYPKRLEEIRQTLELYEEDRQLVAEELSKEFSIELQGTIYTEKSLRRIQSTIACTN